MGVQGSFCAICGGPLNHDRYAEPAFEPRSEHAWLTDVVCADGSARRGAVDDQEFQGGGAPVFVGDGLGAGDALAVHARCWDLAGARLPDDCPRTHTAGWSAIAGFQEQLFAFADCAAQAPWLIADPAGEPRNRRRIEAILSAAPAARPAAPAPGSVAALLATDDWLHARSKAARGSARAGAADCDPAGYADVVLIEKPYLADPAGLPLPAMDAAVQSFALQLQRRVEREALAVLVSILHQGGGTLFTLYTRDAEACQAAIEGLASLHAPRPAEVLVDHDPGWATFKTSLDAEGRLRLG